MKLNADKTNSIICSLSKICNPPHPEIIIDDQVISSVKILKLFGVILVLIDFSGSYQSIFYFPNSWIIEEM